MSLRDRRMGQLTMAIALFFFFACEEESTLLGYKAQSRFDVNFIEIPLQSSVFFFDSLYTVNTGSGDRFLIGQYQDTEMGNVSSMVFTEFLRSGTIPDSLALSYYESAVLRLSFDFYNYGSGEVSNQRLSVHELTDTLYHVFYTDSLYYFNNSEIPLGDKLGELDFQVDPAVFNGFIEDKVDTSVSITVPLDMDPSFGSDLFQSAVDYEVDKDSTFLLYTRFKKVFNGIAIKPETGDKVLGFSPGATNTHLVVYFRHNANNKRDSLVFRFNGLTSFNQIKLAPANDLVDLTEAYQDVEPLSGGRYVQSGTGVVTKLDLSRFITFVDTIPSMVINSADLIVNGVAEQTPFTRQPTGLGLRTLYEDNRLIKTDKFVAQYRGTISSSGFITEERRPNELVMPLTYNADSTDRFFKGNITLFLQELYKSNRDNKVTLQNLALYPLSPSVSKSVNRLTFPMDSVRLRIYYTRPIEYN